MIKNIIFDLGGVILDVDYNKTVDAFRQAGIDTFGSLYSKQKQELLFDRFEKGEISAEAFRQVIKELNPALHDAAIDQAWNSMILETPPERMDFLKSLGAGYNLFLLSNTNEIHIPAFTRYYDGTYGKNYFNSLFKKVYLSSQMGMRKPDAEIFNYVISQNNLKKNETLFIDDSSQHITGALQTGLHAVLLPPGEKIESFLPAELAKFAEF